MPQQQIDINALVERLITGFEDYVRQQEAARTDYLGGMQESNQAYLSGVEGLGTQRQRAVAEYQQPHRMGTGEKILMGASAGLPLLSMAMKPGRGRDVVGGAGALAAGIQRGGIQTRQKAKEEALSLGLGGLEEEGKLLGARHKLGTGYAAAEYDTRVDEYPRMLEMARTVKGLLPKPDKGPTWSDLKIKGLGGLSAEEQKDALYPGLEPTGQLSELQRGNYALKLIDSEIEDILIKANQKYQALDKGLRDRLGGGNITGFIQLENIASRLAEGGIDIKDSWFTGDYAADSTLQGLVDDYNEALQRRRELLQRLSGQGGQTGLGQGLPQGGMGETPLTPEEKAELEARRQRR